MPTFDDRKNFAYSLVATAPSPATSGTSLVVTAGEGTRFPTPPFNATIWPTSVLAVPSNAEIVRVTAISTDTFTITRAQESSTARTVVVGDQIAATITDKVLTDIEAWAGFTVANSDVSVATLVSSAAETTMFTYTVPGGTLGTSGIIIVEFVADALNSSGSNAFFQIKVKYGGVVFGYAAINPMATDANRRSVVGRARLVAAGGTSAQVGDLFVLISKTAEIAAAAPPTGSLVDTTGLNASMNNGLTIDSTTDQALIITFLQTNSASVSSRLHTVHVLKG